LIILLLLACAAAAAAQTATPEPPVIEAGFEQRVRNENWNNLFDYTDRLDDERQQVRYRTRGWLKVPLTSTIDVFAGLNQETNQIRGRDNSFDEVVFENLYIDFKKLFVKGLSLRVGRQNLIRGEGFLLLEGNPWDGSRSIYFNAATLAYEFKKSKLEFMGILNPSRERFLPGFHINHRLLVEWDEQAIGTYYTDRNLKKTSLEAYYFYKKEVRDTRPASNAQYQPDRHISTTGARVLHKFDKKWSFTGEFAGQWGAQHGGRDIHGWAGYGYVKRTCDRKMKPYVLAGYWAFSGDDPKTKTIENWDPIFSRWPKWSELYLYSQFREVAVGYQTNTTQAQLEAGFSPFKKSLVRGTYYKMGAYHPFPGDVRTFSTGTNRGHLMEAKIDYQFTRDLKGHILYETVRSGDFYTAANPSYFLRFEMSYQLVGHVRTPWLKK
jgi:hypothetical protein